MALSLDVRAVEREGGSNDPWHHVDWALMLAVVGIAAVGLAAIYSANHTSITLAAGDTLAFVRRQGMALGAGVVAMVVMMSIDYRRFQHAAIAVYGLAVALLVGVLVAGTVVNDTRAWFELGGFQLQPAEFAKVALIVTLAAYLAHNERPDGGMPFTRFVGALVLTGVLAGLVLLQPDLGSASVLVVIVMGCLLVAGASWKHVAVITVMAAVTAGAVVGSGALEQYQQDRLTAFIAQNPTEFNRDLILQVRNSKAAIAQGGVLGEGWLGGPLTNGDYVPENHPDFVFSAVAEQFGLAGAGVLLALYGFLAVRIWRIARLCKDAFGTVVCAGALGMLAWHVFENVGMTMGITPVTGIPLPLVSYGGSSTVAFLLLVGLVQSVHMRRYA
jgi:rod shape determining protein RodA